MGLFMILHDFVLAICSDTNVNILGAWLVIFHWMNRDNLQRSIFFVALAGARAHRYFRASTSYEVKVLCNHQRNNTYLLHNYFTQWLKYSLFFLVHFIRRWRSQIPVHTGQAGQQRKNCLLNSLYSFTEKSIIIPLIYWHLYLSRLPKQKSCKIM